MYELSLVELEAELAAELPARPMLRARAHAHHGSVANANSTRQVIFNPQIAIITGVNGGLIGANTVPLVIQAGGNSNANTGTQFGVPTNFLG
jgi:hypothetical protein